jgi:hypothetical protein
MQFRQGIGFAYRRWHHGGLQEWRGKRGERLSEKTSYESAKRRNESASCMRFRHGVHQVGNEPWFHHVTDDSNGFRRVHEVFVRMNGEKHHGGRRAGVAKLGRNLETGHSRHRDVQHDHVLTQQVGGSER